MPFILHRVKQHKYVYIERKSINSTRRGYVHLALFYRGLPNLEVRVASAHRFLLWLGDDAWHATRCMARLSVRCTPVLLMRTPHAWP